jgi:hypothetical protein
VSTYGPADWILYTDNINEYEFNNDARPMFLSVDEDEASYIGPARENREMIRNAHLRLELRSLRSQQ